MNLIDLSTVENVDDHGKDFLDTLCDNLGFDYASYATVNPISGDVQGYANYPDEWVLHYTQQEFHCIDPTLTKAGMGVAPTDWGRLRGDDKFQRVFRDAHDFGITERGLTVPIRGPYGDCGLLSVTRNCKQREWDILKTEMVGELQAAAVHMHDNVIRSGVLANALHHPNLSTREIEILQWVAEGKSQQDIGDILSISHRTVEVHLRSGREKLGALNTAQAVGRGIGLGLILPR